MNNTPGRAIAALLSTQLLAAEVYSTFLHLSSDPEVDLWKSLLHDELDHVRHLHSLLAMPTLPAATRLPAVNTDKMRETCAKVTAMGRDAFLLRLEGALRLECAELDYGLEGLVARRLERNELFPGYPGDILAHISTLLDHAKRYSESPNIGRQMTRLVELLETSIKTVPTRTTP